MIPTSGSAPNAAASQCYIPGMAEPITPGQFHEADGVEDWRVVSEGACTYFRTGSFEAGARPVNAISELADLGGHHPHVDLRDGGGGGGADYPPPPPLPAGGRRPPLAP